MPYSWSQEERRVKTHLTLLEEAEEEGAETDKKELNSKELTKIVANKERSCWQKKENAGLRPSGDLPDIEYQMKVVTQLLIVRALATI